MTRLEGFSVTMNHSVAWGEMDALGHVNNARYFSWFESARIAYFDAVGIIHDQPLGVGPILRSTSCTFHSPVKYPSQVVVGTRVTRVGNSSFQMAYCAIDSEHPAEAVAEGEGVVVMVDYRAGKSVPIPQAVRDRIRDLDGV